MNYRVLLDTNSLIYSIRNKIDIQKLVFGMPSLGRIEIPQCVVDELKGLSNSVPEARAALVLAERFEILQSEGAGDDCIISKATEIGAVVLTNDRDLTKRLKDSGIRVISIRGGRTIDFV